MVEACPGGPCNLSFDVLMSNGISPCPNLHRAFDRGLIAVNKHYRVIVSNVFTKGDTSYSIRSFENKEVKLPVQKRYLPTIDNLNWYYTNIFKK